MKHQIVVNLVCLLTVLCALLVAAWTLISGQVGKQGIDALFLLLTCLLIAFSFAVIPWLAVREGMLGKLLEGRRSKGDGEKSQPSGG